MNKEITQKQYSDGECVCFDCALVSDCEWRSRYAKKCGSFAKKLKKP